MLANLRIMHRFFLIAFTILNYCGNFHALHAEHGTSPKGIESNQKSLEPYLLPLNHPLQEKLLILFQNEHMFASPEKFSEAGFQVKLGHHRLMVGFHSCIPKYVIKKFSDRVPREMQLKNYIKRIGGAKILRRYIKEHNFKHLVVPKKWLYKLPRNIFNKKKNYILIVENMNIYDDWEDLNGEARRGYYHMDKEILTELCMILHDVGGCDAFPWNQPLTHSGKIAFVDTEHVGNLKFFDYFIKNIVPALNEENQAYALSLWTKLEEEAQARPR